MGAKIFFSLFVKISFFQKTAFPSKKVDKIHVLCPLGGTTDPRGPRKQKRKYSKIKNGAQTDKIVNIVTSRLETMF